MATDYARLLELMGGVTALYGSMAAFWTQTGWITQTAADSSVLGGGRFIGSPSGGRQVYAWVYRVDLDTVVGECPRAIRPMFAFDSLCVAGPVLYAHSTSDENMHALHVHTCNKIYNLR